MAIDILVNGTVYANCENSLLPATNACDDVLGTRWQNLDEDWERHSPSWWEYDVQDVGQGPGMTKTVQTVRMYVNIDDYGYDYQPKSFLIQGSNNESVWDTLKTIVDRPQNDTNHWETFTFVNTTPYRYYRLYITDCGVGDLHTLYELEMYETLESTAIIGPFTTFFRA